MSPKPRVDRPAPKLSRAMITAVHDADRARVDGHVGDALRDARVRGRAGRDRQLVRNPTAFDASGNNRPAHEPLDNSRFGPRVSST